MKTQIIQLAIIITSLILAAQSNATPATQWDIVGNWEIGYVVEDDTSSFSFTVLSEDMQAGTFSAWDNIYNQAFSGTLSGSSINFTDYQTVDNGWGPFLNVFSIEGTIAEDGTISGPMDQNNGGTDWTGGFWTISGNATVYAGPSFTLQPTSVICSLGSDVTFTANATGNPNPTYQWQFNGTNILGATNASLSILSAGLTDLGLYDVVASNAAGTNVSATVSLSFLAEQCIPSLILQGPANSTYAIQEATVLGGGTNWTTITNVTLNSSQIFVFTDVSALTNGGAFYRAVPQ